MKTIRNFAVALGLTAATLVQAAPAQPQPEWQEDLRPLPAAAWSRDRAAHLLERAGFGGTPAEVEKLAAMSPTDAVRSLVRYQRIKDNLPAFDESGAFDPGLDPFAPSRRRLA